MTQELSKLDRLRHSTAHVMADAVKRLFPEAKITIGPPIETGFYYDFDVPKPFTEDDLERIQAEMGKIIKQDLPFEMEELTRDAAHQLFSEQDENYKLELLDAIPEDEAVSVCRHGDFVDLCRGGHIDSTGKIKAFKLTGVATKRTRCCSASTAPRLRTPKRYASIWRSLKRPKNATIVGWAKISTSSVSTNRSVAAWFSGIPRAV